MSPHLLVICSCAFFLFLTSSTPIHTLASYHKLRDISLSLCPRQNESSVPQCITLTEKLTEIKASLIEEGIKGMGEEDGGMTREDRLIRRNIGYVIKFGMFLAFSDKRPYHF